MREGQVIDDRYEIIRLIGSGGMATVYLAHDRILDRKVAIKFLRLSNTNEENAVKRFQREAYSISELDHPNIVSIYDVGDGEEGHYIVMEYIEGIDLKQYIRDNQPILPSDYQNIMLQILDGIALAHDRGIVHRDLKPQNIMIKPDGTVKIMDFGIATVATETSITQTNTIIGSVHYLSPEQARGGAATPMSDIYSLGIVSFEMLTGHIPFDGESAVSIAIQHFQEPLPDIDQYRDDIPQAMQNVIYKATAKDVNERYQDCREMQADLRTSLDVTRLNENPFIPSKVNGETVVMAKEAIEEQMTATTPVVNQEDTVQKNSPEIVENKPKPPVKKEETTKSLLKKRWKRIVLAIGAVLCLFLLYFYFIRDQNVALPSLANMTENEARATLEAKGLGVSSVQHEYSDTVDKGLIIRTDPAEGSDVKENSQITLVISDGQKPVKMESYVGKSYDDAKAELEKQGFKVERGEANSDTVAKDTIISQNISENQSVVPKETTVKLTVSVGPEEFKMADLTGFNRSGIEQYASSNGLKVNFSESYSDSIASGILISQSIKSGATFIRGDTLNIVLSKGPEKPKTEDFTHDITIPYKAPASSDSSSSSNSSSTTKENEISIYIEDANHSYNSPAETFTITRTKSYRIRFTVEEGKSARFKVVRDGETIMESKVSADES